MRPSKTSYPKLAVFALLFFPARLKKIRKYGMMLEKYSRDCCQECS